MPNYYTGERCIIIDESGNLGSEGRYFVIAAIDTINYKSIQNVLKKKMGSARTLFPQLSQLHSHEIKAKDAYPAVKYHILECIARKDLSISYIVIDLHHVDKNLLFEKNIAYNYFVRILLDNMIDNHFSGKINLICDNKTMRVGSVNSLEDYLNIHFIFESKLDVKFEVTYKDSNASDAYPVQAADYAANALYAKYEYDYNLFSDLLASKISQSVKFPRSQFGK